jgi:hypothetical protein
MQNEITLDRFQRWMQAFIVHPGTAEQALLSIDAVKEISPDDAINFVLPSRSLTSIERIGIYHNMYLWRMCEALQIDYPGLYNYLGDDDFRELVQEYIKVYPSQSHSLNFLGQHLPEFIKTLNTTPQNLFIYELACAELAICNVFDAQNSDSLSIDIISSMTMDRWESARLKPIEALRVLAFNYPINNYLQSVYKQTERSIKFKRIRRKKSWLIIYRHNYSLRRMDLSQPAYKLLQLLINGIPLGRAISRVVKNRQEENILEHISQWLKEWFIEGFFQEIY